MLVVGGIVSIPLGALQAAATHSQAAAPLSSDARRIILDGLAVAAVILVVGLACAPLLKGFLHIRSMFSTVLLAVWFGLAAAAAVPFGLLLGQQRFATAGAVLLSGNGIVRLLAGVLLAGPLGVAGAMLSTVFGALVSLAAGIYALREQVVRPSGPVLRISARMGLLSVGALVGMAVLAGIDTLVAQHVMGRTASGTYAAAATVARMAMFTPGAVALVAFPRFAEAFKQGRDDTRLLAWSVGLTVLLASGTAAGIVLEPQLVVRVMFGSRFQGAVGLVSILSLEGALLAVLSLLVYYLLARQSRISLIAWIGCAVVPVGALTSKLLPQPLSVLMVTCVAGLTVVAVAVVVLTKREDNWRRPREGGVHAGCIDPPALELTLVMPFFNPGMALRPHVEAVVRELDAVGISYEIIPVSDGSTDGSFEMLNGLRPDVVHPVALPANLGKGEALRVGLSRGRGRYLGFIDADGDIPADLVSKFVRTIGVAEPDLAIGSKRHPESVVSYPLIRRIYSWGYQQLVHILVDVDASDTQTGLKFIRRDVLAEVLPRTLEKRFAFDVELLAVAHRFGYCNVIELPVHVTHEFGSTIHPRDVVNALRDTLAIFYRLRLVHYYDRPAGESTLSQAPRLATPLAFAGALHVSPDEAEA